VTCTSCGAQNDPGRKFCLECGTPLALVCPACGSPNPAVARFCGACGGRLSAESAASAASAGSAAAGAPGTAGPASAGATAERRLVSVLFADLAGFTALAEQSDLEDVRDLLSRYYDLARGMVERHGGTVEKFIGDAVMAVWGTPTSHEDDAERAVRAALEVVGAVRTLGPSLQARAAVVTGEAAVTLGAVSQGMVAGDMVNTASRLQAAAPAGVVLVGEATMHAAAGAIAFEEAGEQLLRGKTLPVLAWRALRVVAERGGRARSAALEPPFVGRDDELRLVKDLFHATARERRVRLVSITGQAGIGKSRLAWEFLKYVDGLVETVYSSPAPASRLVAGVARAGIDALEGRPGAARSGLLAAWTDLGRAGFARGQALAGLIMATLLDEEAPEVLAAIAESRRFFERAGARL